jgi:hypothetical protein
MNSMNRNMYCPPLNLRAIGKISCSFTPLFTTMLIFTGPNPASTAASIPSSTRPTGKSTSFIARKIPSSSASKLTVTRCNPASLNGLANTANPDPFVVSVISFNRSISASIATNFVKSRRNNGSPPVSRTFSTPNPANNLATLANSSSVKISLFGKNE